LRRIAQAATDVVLDWNVALLDAIRIDRTAPPLAAYNMAMVQTAVFDAVNSLTQTYQGYHTPTVPIPVGKTWQPGQCRLQ
jgi:hypothetical protein